MKRRGSARRHRRRRRHDAGDAKDGVVRGDPVQLLLPRRLRLGEDDTLPRLDPRLLHLLPTLHVTGGADWEKTPSWLGFRGAAPHDCSYSGW
jgi:hypothetical protein